MPAAVDIESRPTLETLPGDELRQLMWRFGDRYDLAMLVQSARTVARGPVARLVAAGARNSHEWTAEKASLLAAFDESGITAAFLDPEFGGFLEGPKNLALALIAFELSWSTPARPRAAWPAIWAWRPSANAALPSNAPAT